MDFVTGKPGELLATDNGDPTSFTSFQSPVREAFNGMALGIVRFKTGARGRMTVVVEAEGLTPARLVITAAQ